MRIDEATFIVTDTETTGARPADARLLEIGAVRVDGLRITERFQQLIDPQRAVPRWITDLTGISTAMVFGQPPAERVLPDYLDFLGDGILVAHNLRFDEGFLNAELDLAGLPALDNNRLCTLRLARRLLPGLPSKGLDALVKHFGVRVEARHRALGDAEATAHILILLLDRLRTSFGIETVEQLLLFQNQRYKTATGEPSSVRRIREKVLPGLPDRPGVYFMKDSRGQVIYIGKAKSLRNRVRSYFNGIDAHPEHTRKLVYTVRGIDWQETGSELGAVLLESKLIKSHLPRFNRAGRRYSRYAFLRLDTTHDFPTLTTTSLIRSDGAEYYGPVGKRRQAEEIVELINRLFKLRECNEGVFRQHRACLYQNIGRCTAPCTGEHAPGTYTDEVQRVRQFITGQDEMVQQTVEEAMRRAALERNYEDAAWYRDQLRRLERTLGRKRQLATAVHDLNAVLVEPGRDEGAVELFMLRFGRLVATTSVQVPVSDMDRGRTGELLALHYSGDQVPPALYEVAEVDEIRLLAHWTRLLEGRARLVHWRAGDSPERLADAVLSRVAG
jgi:DNA polymerase III subunit epsilon